MTGIFSIRASRAEDLDTLMETYRHAKEFMAAIGDDPTYSLIEDGAWIADGEYGTIHRLASTGIASGVASACIGWCWERSEIRIYANRRIIYSNRGYFGPSDSYICSSDFCTSDENMVRIIVKTTTAH